MVQDAVVKMVEHICFLFGHDNVLFWFRKQSYRCSLRNVDASKTICLSYIKAEIIGHKMAICEVSQ